MQESGLSDSSKADLAVVAQALSRKAENADSIFKKMVEADKEQNKRLSVVISCSTGKLINERRKASRFQVRFLVCTVGLFAILLSQMSRIVVNVCITSMIDPSMIVSTDSVSSDGSCPVDELTELTTGSMDVNSTTSAYDPILAFFEDETYSTKASSIGTDPTTATDTSSTMVAEGPKPVRFKWTMKEQNLLLGGFYYSYFVFMIFAGRIAEMYGSRYVILAALAGSALINLATPWMSRSNFYLLVGSRMLLGATQSGVFPALYALFGKWLTLTEASIYTPLIKLSLKLGILLASMLPGFLDDWADVFYSTGLACLLATIVWLFVATSSPEENSWVSESEVKHIARKKRKTDQVASVESGIELESTGHEAKKTKAAPKGAPWLKILTSPSVIGLSLSKLAESFATSFLSIELPSYLRYVHHSSKESISLILSAVAIWQICSVLLVSWLAKEAIVKRPFGLSRTSVRKLFQSVANLGIASTFILITLDSCNVSYVATLLQFTAVLIMFVAGGETMLPYDLSDQYLATIAGIANSLSNTTGTALTLLTGFVVADQAGSYRHWNIIIIFVGLVNLLGCACFCLLVKAEPIDFESDKQPAKQGTANGAVDDKQVVADEQNLPA